MIKPGDLAIKNILIFLDVYLFNALHMQVHSPNGCAPIRSASPTKPSSGASTAIASTEEKYKKDIGEGGAEPSHVKIENGCAAVKTFQMLQASVMENAQVRFTRRACSPSLAADLI